MEDLQAVPDYSVYTLWLGCRKLCKSKRKIIFIGDDTIWLGDKCKVVKWLMNSEVARLFAQGWKYYGTSYTYKVHTNFGIGMYERLVLSNHKSFLLLTRVSILHRKWNDWRDDRYSRDKKETGVATPIGCQAHYCVERSRINSLTNA